MPDTQRLQVKKLSTCHEHDALHPCTPQDRYQLSDPNHVPVCVRMGTSLFPKDLWGASDRLATLANIIAYGRKSVAGCVSLCLCHIVVIIISVVFVLV